MTARWLSEFPQYPMRDGYGFEPGDNRSVFETELGPGLGERRSSSAPDLIVAPFYFTTSQKMRFERWVDEDLDGGVKPFWRRAIETEDMVLATSEGQTLLTDGGAPIAIEEWNLLIFARDQPLPRFQRLHLDYAAVLNLWRIA